MDDVWADWCDISCNSCIHDKQCEEHEASQHCRNRLCTPSEFSRARPENVDVVIYTESAKRGRYY